ncbi:hypothetical protein EG327_000074 [Venturia inaequalis]|uniref:Uncharacterized protein n=1 Tax=Venturia inaequalis TaxID=5025 RepID=A0A8H3VVB1_VENIN|nr:hypothetical protein EG327_000074 [Venturia inaequalis]
MTTTRTRWPLGTFFTHIAARNVILLPDLGVGHKLHAQPTTTIASSNAPPRDARAARLEPRLDSLVEKSSSGPPRLNHDGSQAASGQEVRNRGIRESHEQLDTHDAPTMQASEGGDQAFSIPSKPSITPKSYLDLPLEIRQQILFYIVSYQVRMDTKWVHSQWRQKHRLHDAMDRAIWTNGDQQLLNELSDMIVYYKDNNKTQAQIHFVEARLSKTLKTFRAQKMKTKSFIDQMKTTIGIQREVNRELREENEKLVLALEMRDVVLC